jgi:hypothetical protein
MAIRWAFRTASAVRRRIVLVIADRHDDGVAVGVDVRRLLAGQPPRGFPADGRGE